MQNGKSVKSLMLFWKVFSKHYNKVKDVNIKGFGGFEPKIRKARNTIHPRSKQPVHMKTPCAYFLCYAQILLKASAVDAKGRFMPVPPSLAARTKSRWLTALGSSEYFLICTMFPIS